MKQEPPSADVVRPPPWQRIVLLASVPAVIVLAVLLPLLVIAHRDAKAAREATEEMRRVLVPAPATQLTEAEQREKTERDLREVLEQQEQMGREIRAEREAFRRRSGQK